MDPNANLKEQLRIAKRILNDELVSDVDVVRLAELVRALDEWLRRGGVLPEAWLTISGGRQT